MDTVIDIRHDLGGARAERAAAVRADVQALIDVTFPVLDVVVPVYNEQADLERCVRRLDAHLATSLPFSYRITIADNASTDETWAIARRLSDELHGVRTIHLDEKGRGRALKRAWLISDADVLAYMDVDLSTDLAAVLPLVAPLISGHSDLAIGTRLARGSRVVRGPKREVISRGYNLILRTVLAARFSDAQCGFKAIRADRARQLLPLIEDTGWFFDTELLVLAERAGMRVHEVPVDWLDDPDSRVDIASTALDDLKGVARLRRGLSFGALAQALGGMRDEVAPDTFTMREAGPAAPTGSGFARQLVRFCVIGAASTLAYAGLYLLFRAGMSAQWANALALLLTAVANTAANRRLTFGVRGASGQVRHQAQGLIVFALGFAVTSGSLAVLHTVEADPRRAVELVVLIAASAVATLLRFALFRTWMFPQARRLARSAVRAQS